MVNRAGRGSSPTCGPRRAGRTLGAPLPSPLMFDTAELGLTLSERAYDSALRTLRPKLLKAHIALQASGRQVLVIVSGGNASGKGELVHRLNEWLDPRGVTTQAFWDHSDEESERPHFWRFWRAMPGAGKIGIFFGSWYTWPIVDRVTKARRKREFVPELDRIVAFERMLADGGITVLKLWMHLTKPRQRARLKELEKMGRLAPDDWSHFKQYDRFRAVSQQAVEHTHHAAAPWHVVDATDRRHREVAVGRLLLKALQAAPPSEPAPPRRWTPGPSALDRVDLTQRLSVAAYEREMVTLRERLARLTWAARAAGQPTVLVFEGWDAAGKGSSIRRVTQAIDPRLYRVVGFAAPTDEERAQHYLWRFWRHLPRDGRITIFDRSWYGRVLVERVEGFAKEAEWERPTARSTASRSSSPRTARRWPSSDPHQPGRAAQTLQGAPAGGVEAAQDHRRGLAKPRAAPGVQGGGRGDAGALRPTDGAVDRGGGQ